MFKFLRRKNKTKNNNNQDNFKKKQITITENVANSIVTYAKTWHPNEGILILQGKNNKREILINGIVIPPFSHHGPYYSGFPTSELPLDLSYIGTAHSHPSYSNAPSLEDLNNFFGIVSIIISYPYTYESIAAYDRNGKRFDIIFK